MKGKLALLCMLLAVIFTVTGCGQNDANTAADTPGGTTTKTTGTTETMDNLQSIPEFSIAVEVVGEGGKSFEFTNKDAASIGPVEITAAIKDKDNPVESSTYTGITLNDFLDYIGVPEFSAMSIESTTGMTEELDTSRLVEGGAGFCWMKDGEALPAENAPVEFVNDGRGPKHWISPVASITIVK